VKEPEQAIPALEPSESNDAGMTRVDLFSFASLEPRDPPFSRSCLTAKWIRLANSTGEPD